MGETAVWRSRSRDFLARTGAELFYIASLQPLGYTVAFEANDEKIWSRGIKTAEKRFQPSKKCDIRT